MFYEYPPPQPGSSRTKRQVKYVRGTDTYSYATGLTRLPGNFEVETYYDLRMRALSSLRVAQWTAWMSHTRAHPPTIEVPALRCSTNIPIIYLTIVSKELQADLARRQRVTYLAAQIQAKDELERQQQLENPTFASLQPPSESQQSPDSPSASREATPEELRAEAQLKTRLEEPQGTRNPVQASDAPEGWAPTSARRRG